MFRQETNIKKTCSKQNEVMNGEKKKKKDEEIVFLREMVAELGDKVHQLQQELAIATTSKTATITTAAATATNAMTAMTMMDHKGKENEHKGLVSPASFRPGNKRALERNHSMYSEGSVMDTMEPFLDYYDSKQGVLARPKWVTKYPKLGNVSSGSGGYTCPTSVLSRLSSFVFYSVSSCAFQSRASIDTAICVWLFSHSHAYVFFFRIRPGEGVTEGRSHKGSRGARCGLSGGSTPR